MVHLNNSSPYKILHLITTLGTGGAQIIVYQISRFADRDKYDFTICSCQGSGHYEAVFKEKGFDVETISTDRHSIILFPLFLYDVFRTLFRLLYIIKSRKIDIIHAHLTDSSIYGVIAGKLSGRPVVVTIHNNIIMPYRRSAPVRNWLRKKVLKAVFSWADMLIGVGEDVGKSMREQGHLEEKTPIVTVMNGVDYEKFAQARDVEQIRERLGLPLDANVISCVSRLVVSKGQTYLIQAAARLKEKFPLLRVLLVGDGSLLRELQEEAKQAGLYEQIWFLGRRSDVPEIMVASDVFALPSLYEGVPLVVLEAMASRKPVVATDIPGTRELIADAEDGFLVKPKDSAALARRIDELLSNPNLANSMGEKARAKVEKHFRAKMMVKKIEAVYQQVLEKR